MKFGKMPVSLILLVGGIFTGTFVFMRSSLPQLDGEIHLRGIAHPVKVLRDQYGIPHIKAEQHLDGLKALGFVIASDRLFQMELARRLTQGELSEVVGEAALQSDKLYRTLMLKKSVLRMLDFEKSNGIFDTQLWDEMQAFCDGINEYIQTQPHSFEFTLLGISPKPFTPIDAYIMTGHMAYSFGIATRADPLMTELAKLYPDRVSELRNDPLKTPLQVNSFDQLNPAAVVSNVSNQTLNLDSLAIPFFDGSNSWLLSSKKSASGKPIFANDPHIGFSLPSVWIEAHIKTDQLDLYGHYLPVVPFAVLGHTRDHAWGFTMSLADDMDLYKESLDRKSKKVLYRNRWTDYTEWTETIKVKGKPDYVFQMIETPHGPLLNELLPTQDLALKWAFHRPQNNPMKSLRGMARAPNIVEFEKALQYGTAPGLNVMYADKENIAWWMFGDIAVKQNPNSDFLFDGASGKDEYIKTLDWKDKPHRVNPEEGFILTANSRPQNLSAEIRGDWQSDDRYQTIKKALLEKDTWTAEDAKKLQIQNFNSKNPIILNTLLANLNETLAQDENSKTALTALKNWDFRSEIDSKAASLFHQWNNEVILLLLSDFPSEKRLAYLDTPYAWVFYERVLQTPDSLWWKDSQKQIISQAFANMMSKWDQPPNWGDIHQIEFTHPLGRSFPLDRVLNVGPLAIPGSYNDITNNKMKALGGDFKVRAGASTRRVIDMNSPETSWGINPLGVSGHRLSKYYQDQTPLFLEGRHRTQLMNFDDIEKVKSHELKLIPQN